MIFEYGLIGDVVWGAGACVVRERAGEFVATPQKQVAVAYAGDEFDCAAIFRVAGDFLLGRSKQDGGIFGCDVVGGEVAHHLVFDRDQVAANRPIFGAEFNALGGRFHWSAAREIIERVITEQAEIADFGSGGQLLRGVAGAGDDAHFDDAIHVGSLRGL